MSNKKWPKCQTTAPEQVRLHGLHDEEDMPFEAERLREWDEHPASTGDAQYTRTDIAEAKVAELESARNILEGTCEKLSKWHALATGENIELSKRADRAVHDLRAARHEVHVGMSKRDELTDKLRKAHSQVDRLRIERDRLHSQVDNLRNERDKLKTHVSELNHLGTTTQAIIVDDSGKPRYYHARAYDALKRDVEKMRRHAVRVTAKCDELRERLTQSERARYHEHIVAEDALQERDVLRARIAMLEKQLRRDRCSRDFYMQRCEALQVVQSKMRDPERKAVCDILANGMTYEL